MRRKRNVLDDSDEDSDAGSQSADSDDTVNNSRPATKKKATARKRGRPPGTTKKKAQQDDSDDGGSSTRTNTPQNGVQSSEDEDNSGSNSAALKMKATARKRGRPPGTTKKKAQQDDSDDGGSSTRPNTPQNGIQSSEDEDNSGSNSAALKMKATARKRGRPPGTTKKTAQQDDSDDGESSTRPNTPQNNNQSSEDEDDSGDSDYVADSTSRPKRRPGRTPVNNKRQRLQNGTSRDASPLPNTSQQLQNGTNQNAQEAESDSDSADSESADSDFGLFNERSLAKKKPAKKLPQRTAKNKPSNFAGSNSNRTSVNTSQLNMNASLKKGSKLNQTPAYDPSTDLKLVESLAQKLVYFLLIEDQKKYAIRRKGIVTHVFKDDYSPKLYGAVIRKANVILKKIYGIQIMTLENQKDSYLIANILKPDLGIHEFVDLPRMKQQQHGLISFLLTVIYMNENVITEDELTRCLKPLGIDLTSKRLHPVFGDVKKYITTELVKQMYLNYECISKEPPRYEYTWGLRAKQEFDKRDLLQFVCTIMDDTSPEDWRIQFRDAETSAKPNTDSSTTLDSTN